MAGEQAAAVVALVQEEAHGIAFAKAELKLHAVFASRESFWGGCAQHQLRGGFGPARPTEWPRQEFMVGPARGEDLGEASQFPPLCRRKRLCALR